MTIQLQQEAIRALEERRLREILILKEVQQLSRIGFGSNKGSRRAKIERLSSI